MIKFKKSVDLFIPDNRQVNINKGHDFQNYVAHLFYAKNDYFAIQEWTTDHSDKRAGIKVESDSKPDFIVRYKPDNGCFAVEAKWRAYPLYDPKIRDYVIQWAEPYQIKNYQTFSKKMNIPVPYSRMPVEYQRAPRQERKKQTRRKNMADLVQNSQIKNAVRVLASPITDVTAFNSIVQSVITDNPFACVAYMTDRNNRPGRKDPGMVHRTDQL